MIKTVIRGSNEEQDTKYPFMGVTNEGLVVIFTAKRTGMVIKTNDPSFNPIGAFRDNWAEEKYFEPFTGTIELSNK